MNNQTEDFKIGDTFQTRGKNKHLCTITDVFKTYNSKNELVKVSYVATHDFFGQTITEYNIPKVTIQMGKVA